MPYWITLVYLLREGSIVTHFFCSLPHLSLQCWWIRGTALNCPGRAAVVWANVSENSCVYVILLVLHLAGTVYNTKHSHKVRQSDLLLAFQVVSSLKWLKNSSQLASSKNLLLCLSALSQTTQLTLLWFTEMEADTNQWIHQEPGDIII